MMRWAVAALLWFFAVEFAAADWPQFRGPRGLGVASDKNLPTTWSDNDHLLWKTELPGPGASSPIVVGAKIFVTCYSGYGVKADDPGDIKNLKRHLLCLDRNGKILWNRTVAADVPDHEYSGYQVLHGYASSTPASDGKRIFCFFGVAGVVAFDLDGKQLWRQSVGHNTHSWGSAASPIVVGEHVIVNASVESGALVALRTTDGRVAWTQKGVDYSWSSPLLLESQGRKEVLISLYQRVAAYAPDTGKELWRCTGLADYVCPSLTHVGETVFVVGGRPNTSIAIRAGGNGDLGASNLLWTVKRGSNVSSPVYYDGHFYWASESRGTVHCVNAATGAIVYDERLEPDPDTIYASALLADGKIYYVSRTRGTYVIQAGTKFKQLAHNTFASDRSVFNASPAAIDGRLLLRSDRYLYCLGATR
ncbi:MAG: PQQ-binding-like beta-propeller repeat protein [Gemmataceae bacterium]|nr:PQQ-binding-like beta-propeller repeat protein [Gemmataceae bacterium]